MTGWKTTNEVANALGISPRRVRQLAESRKVIGRKVGGIWLWPPSILRKLAKRETGRPKS